MNAYVSEPIVWLAVLLAVNVVYMVYKYYKPMSLRINWEIVFFGLYLLYFLVVLLDIWTRWKMATHPAAITWMDVLSSLS